MEHAAGLIDPVSIHGHQIENSAVTVTLTVFQDAFLSCSFGIFGFLVRLCSHILVPLSLLCQFFFSCLVLLAALSAIICFATSSGPGRYLHGFVKYERYHDRSCLPAIHHPPVHELVRTQRLYQLKDGDANDKPHAPVLLQVPGSKAFVRHKLPPQIGSSNEGRKD